MIWICFAAIAVIIIFAGSRLSVFADRLAGLLNLSRSAVGILLVSFVTTLPELSTTMGAIIKVGEPNLALGNNIGSVLFNLMIIAVCDIFFRRGGILRQTSDYVPCMFHSMLLLILMLLALIAPNAVRLFGFNFACGSVFVIAAYLAVFFATHRNASAGHEKILDEFQAVTDQVAHSGTRRATLAKTLAGFLISAVVVVVSGLALASIGDRIAETTGLGKSFVGTLFLAIATSLPELAVGITSVRIGAYDLMIGNVAGANMLNVLVIAVADLVHRKEALHIPDNLSRSQLLTGFCAILVTLLVMGAMKQKKKSRFGFGWESIVMLAVYTASLYALYKGFLC